MFPVGKFLNICDIVEMGLLLFWYEIQTPLLLHSIFQDEKTSCTLDKPLDIQRRHSLVPPGTGHPTISITSDDNSPDRPRRPSTHSLGPFSVSGFGEYHYRGSERPRRPSTHSVGILPISMFGEGGERPRRPSTHSLGVFCFGEDRDKYDRPRRPSTHSLGPLVVPVSYCPVIESCIHPSILAIVVTKSLSYYYALPLPHYCLTLNMLHGHCLLNVIELTILQ